MIAQIDHLHYCNYRGISSKNRIEIGDTTCLENKMLISTNLNIEIRQNSIDISFSQSIPVDSPVITAVEQTSSNCTCSEKQSVSILQLG